MIVEYSPTNVIQYNACPPKLQRRREYYPFGLQTERSWTREESTENNYLYNQGNELNKSTNWYEMHYRGYDPALGRMLQVDPYASSFNSLTPFNYAGNSPMMMNDPTGGYMAPPEGWSPPKAVAGTYHGKMAMPGSNDHWADGIGNEGWTLWGGDSDWYPDNRYYSGKHSPNSGRYRDSFLMSRDAFAAKYGSTREEYLYRRNKEDDDDYDGTVDIWIDMNALPANSMTYISVKGNKAFVQQVYTVPRPMPVLLVSTLQSPQEYSIPDEKTWYSGMHFFDFDVVREHQIKHTDFGYTETVLAVTVSYGEGTKHKIEKYGYVTKSHHELRYGTFEQWRNSPYINTVYGSKFEILPGFQDEIYRMVNGHLMRDYYTDWIFGKNRLSAVTGPHK